jgi:2-polyprenyl-3-methyl-5-hydroxy-6-metoxy-1,4-benzoquinol methylase
MHERNKGGVRLREKRLIQMCSSIKDKIKDAGKKILVQSLKNAIREQKLEETYKQLEQILPNIDDQYTNDKIEDEYYRTKIRGLHAFQISLVKKALELLKYDGKQKMTIVDIGDSSGNHLLYLKAMFNTIDSLSVNLDKNAVEKIIGKGLRAIHTRAEKVQEYNINPDIYLSFEMIEHLHDPCNFLKAISETNCKLFVATVPYVKQSRIGLHHITNKVETVQSGEAVHIFELSPEDWKLLFKHSGWEIAYERTYMQYPKIGAITPVKTYFKNKDYEGFYGAILKPNPLWKDRYKDW